MSTKYSSKVISIIIFIISINLFIVSNISQAKDFNEDTVTYSIKFLEMKQQLSDYANKKFDEGDYESYEILNYMSLMTYQIGMRLEHIHYTNELIDLITDKSNKYIANGYLEGQINGVDKLEKNTGEYIYGMSKNVKNKEDVKKLTNDVLSLLYKSRISITGTIFRIYFYGIPEEKIKISSKKSIDQNIKINTKSIIGKWVEREFNEYNYIEFYENGTGKVNMIDKNNISKYVVFNWKENGKNNIIIKPEDSDRDFYIAYNESEDKIAIDGSAEFICKRSKISSKP